MRCAQCGHELTESREQYVYDNLGMRLLLRNVLVRRCLSCKEFEVAIEKMQALRRVIAQHLVKKPSNLTGAEFRFLRKFLGWSSIDLAKRLSVTATTVSRWENDKKPLGAMAERMLRLLVLNEAPIEDYSAHDMLDALSEGSLTTAWPLEFVATEEQLGWCPAHMVP